MSKDALIETWSDNWRKSGVLPGSVLLVHSSIRRTLKDALLKGIKDISPADILESFIRALGPQGTLLLPLFNFEFTKGIPFDISQTPSQMGVLTEMGRTYPGAVRTGHPIYSFAVIGARAHEFEKVVNKSGYGEDSPFAMLRAMGGTIAVLDLPDQTSMTFYHHVEEMHQVDYRYFRSFTAPYVGWDGGSADKTFQLFVRDLEKGVLTDVNRMGEFLWKLGAYKGDRPGEKSGLRTIKAEDLYQATSNVIREGRAKDLLYSIKS